MPEIKPGPADFRSGFVALAGLPNAGKSTLLNALCGFRLSSVSARPQTTRNNIIGILDTPGVQAVFVDTPGMLKPRNLFEKSMAVSISRAASEDADLVCAVADPAMPPEEKLGFFADLRRKVRAPLWLVLNKADLPAPAAPAREKLEELLKPDAVFSVSALQGRGVAGLRERILAALPPGQPFYPPGQATDRWERFFAGEIVREKIFELYSDEVPYACAVEIDEFRESPSGPDRVRALIHCERASHKPILIGKAGSAIKRLREKSEKAIEAMTGRALRLELSVKVTPGWTNDIEFLRRTGFYERK